jgi:alpha-ribazole phosphatase
MPLWIARHARPLIDGGICYGILDVAADTLHTDQCALALHQNLPIGIAVICSPLQRCQQLAKALQLLRPALIVELDSRIAEMNFGCWEGMLWSEIPKEAFDVWTADFGRHAFGGIESVNSVLARVKLAHESSLKRNQSILWITHAGIVRAVELLNQGIYSLRLAEQWPHESLLFGEYRLVNS